MNDGSRYVYDVTVIIVNYRTQNLIKDCLRSLLTHVRDISYEVIVVDNASGEDYKTVIEEEFPNLCRYVDMKENVGFGRANNAGVEIASGRNIFYLNPDTILLNNAVKILSDYLDNHKEVGAVGGNLYDADMQPTLSFRRMMPGVWWEINELAGFIPERLRYGKNVKFNNTGKPLRVGYITGADLMIPARIVAETGGFSPEFFMYYEETDLCRRITGTGLSVVSVPAARICHLEGRSFDGSLNKNRLKRIEIGRATYIRRNCNAISGRISNSLHCLLLKSRVWFRKSEFCRYRLDVIKGLRNNI